MNKKEAILEAAIRLFVNQGFEETSTTEISDAVGVAAGTLFYHYKSKDKLINEAYLFVKRKLKKYIHERFTPSKDFKETFKDFWKAYLEWGLEHEIDNQFIAKFRNSKYLHAMSIEEVNSLFNEYEGRFKEELKKNKLKKWSFIVHGDIIFYLHEIFIKEFSTYKKINDKDIERSFEVVWDAVSK